MKLNKRKKKSSAHDSLLVGRDIATLACVRRALSVTSTEER